MPIRPSLSYTNNPGGVPASYVLPPGSQIQVNSITAELNAAGASGPFKACVAVYSQDGKLIGRWFPSTLFQVGDSGEVTWSPFLADEIASGVALVAACEVLATAQSVATSYTTLSYGTEIYDPAGFHSNTVNPSRLTVPTGLGGYYLILSRAFLDGVGVNNYQGVRVRANGSTVIDTQESWQSTSYQDAGSLVWTFLELAEGEYVESQAIQVSGGPRDMLGRMDMVKVEDLGVCLARFSGAQSIASSTWTTVDLTDDIDPDGMHSDTVNPSRITALHDGIYLVMAAGNWAGAAGGSRGVRITRSGSAVGGAEQFLIAASTATQQGTHAWALVSMSVGEYVEAQHWQSTGAGLNLTAARLLMVDVGSVQCGYANGVGSFSLVPSSWTPVALANEQVDPYDWHSNAVNPSRFVCRQACTVLALTSALTLSPQNVVGARLRKNGADASGHTISPGNNVLSISAGAADIVTLVVDDYIETAAYEGDAGDTCDRTRSAMLFVELAQTIV